MANLLYGSGLRLIECLRLRVNDVDFGMRQITVRDGEGFQDRVTMLPDSVIDPLQRHLVKVRELHQADLDAGLGDVYLPYALARKYPGAGREWGWQYVFPSSKCSIDPYSGVERRHHLDEKVLQRAVRQAVRDADLTKPASCHTLRHSFATYRLLAGYDIRTVQELLGHKDISTMPILRRRSGQVYTHVLNKGGKGVQSPLDRLG